MAVRRDKRNNTWMYDGKYKQGDKWKSYHKTGFKTKKDASAAENLFLQSLKPSKSITFERLNEIWTENALDLKESTLKSHKSRHEQTLSKYFGNTKLEDIKPMDIEKFKAELVSKGYKEGTINLHLKHLRKMFNYAIKRDLLIKNPCASVSLYKKPNNMEKKDSTKIWKKEDFQKYIKCMKSEYRLFFISLYLCGMREGEALGLTWDDIDFEKKRITIDKQWNDNVKKITTPKTNNSYRTIPITDTLCYALKKRFESSSMYDGFSSDWYVFGSYKPFPLSTIRTMHRKAIELSEVDFLPIHSFRHTCASNLIKLGTIPDIVIAEYLGDTIETIYKTYAHVYDNSREEMREILNKEFSDKFPTE